jgi:hypothetical protein
LMALLITVNDPFPFDSATGTLPTPRRRTPPGR